MTRPRALASLTLVADGVRLAAVPGETVAATLAAHGIRTLGRGKDGAPRGLYCGMGVCHDCLVTVDGRASQRACLTPVAEGMAVETQGSRAVAWAAARTDLAAVPGAAPARETVDVLVVGAGPGGLAAADAAAGAGASVRVVDERPAPGGQYFKQASTPAAAVLQDRQMSEGRRWIDALASRGIVPEGGTSVWGAARDAAGRLEISTLRSGVVGLIVPRILIVATGAHERPVMVPGWTLPGVMTTGAAQTLGRSYGVAPGDRVVVAGHGPLNLQVGRELQRLGATVTLVEAAPAPWTRPAEALALLQADRRLAGLGLATLARFRAAGGSVHFGHRLVAVEGLDGVEAALVAPVGPDGGEIGPRLRIPASIVCTGDGFAPSSELARLLGCSYRPDPAFGPGLVAVREPDGATDQPDIHVVGEAGGFGGAPTAMAQGTLAGAAAARTLGLSPAADEAAARQSLDAARAFQAALWRLFAPAGPAAAPRGDVIVCRCEAVTAETLLSVVDRHRLRDVASLKRLTRAGMGRCQGRYCGPVLHALVDAPPDPLAGAAPQAPLKPVPLAALAAEKPEWGGHRRVVLPDRPPRPGPPLPVTTAGTVVIGAGIAGLSTALFLARGGEDVVVLDAGRINGGASGGNAGSLHAQLLSFDFGARAEAGGSPAALTLPLQADSIALWQALQAESDADFEIKITGGLMVAEGDKDLAFLAQKTALERQMGIACEVIGANELRSLEPALDERFVGAAFCPQEGKINPLTATPAVAALAEAAGARLVLETTVIGIAVEADGAVVIETSRGRITARRVVNAAGAFASRVGAMLGLTVPVHGAPLQMVVTEPAEPLVSRLVAHADRHLTLKQAGNGTVIIGGGWTAGLDPVHQHPRPLRPSLEGNLWVAQHVVPALRRLHVVRSWAAMNINIDGAPILGAVPELPQVYTAVTSNGYTLGPIVGQVTANLILGRDPGRDVSPFSLARFG